MTSDFSTGIVTRGPFIGGTGCWRSVPEAVTEPPRAEGIKRKGKPRMGYVLRVAEMLFPMSTPRTVLGAGSAYQFFVQLLEVSGMHLKGGPQTSTGDLICPAAACANTLPSKLSTR